MVSASRDDHAILCSTSKKDSFSALWSCWRFGTIVPIVCTSLGSLVSLQPSVFVPLTDSIGRRAVVSVSVLVNDVLLLLGTLRYMLFWWQLQRKGSEGRISPWESEAGQCLVPGNEGLGKGKLWLWYKKNEGMEKHHFILISGWEVNSGTHKRKSHGGWSNFQPWKINNSTKGVTMFKLFAVGVYASSFPLLWLVFVPCLSWVAFWVLLMLIRQDRKPVISWSPEKHYHEVRAEAELNWNFLLLSQLPRRHFWECWREYSGSESISRCCTLL